MVKVGFIVEGTSDFIFLKSEKFQNLLTYKFAIECNEGDVIIAGNKSDLKKRFVSYLNKLNKSVRYIFIMVDQDDKENQKRNRKYNPPDCPLIVAQEICNFGDNKNYLSENLVFIIMKREFEAWLLADWQLEYKFEGLPEDIINPSAIIEKQEKTTNHVIIAKRVIGRFSLERASENAPSAKRFLNKLTDISTA